MSSTSPEEAPASENDISGQQPATSAGSSVHNLTNQLSFTMSSVSEAMGRQWGQLSQRSQTIDLGIIPG